jgi:N-acetyl-anhydromuramyl-L-alanine amidase AmpD
MGNRANLKYILPLIVFSALLVFTSGVHGSECYLDSSVYPVTKYCPASSDNYLPRTRTPSQINYIVIHTVQGSLESAVNTFSSPDLNYPRSAHFTIGKDGEIIKSVPSEKIAWHAGTHPLGSGESHESKVLNRNSIGIEHGGNVGGPEFPTEEQYATSAALTRYLCELYRIPIDRDHIVGHEEIKSTKGDPGPNWDWGYYMSLVKNGITKPKVAASSADSGSRAEVQSGGRLLPSLTMIGVGIALLSLAVTGN